ncbi:MAG: acyloxyacyl hydrolase [Cyclobacteriaceae bacterium]|nr:acyloxyacyl hydrolase [Cyclobacteriaceae bacterium]
MLWYLAILFLLVNLVNTNAFGQENPKFINQKTIGGFISTGFPLYKLEEGTTYQPLIIGGALHLPFYQTKSRFNIALDIAPQVGFVPYKNKVEYEFGLNFIIAFGFQIGENSILSINVGAGPHYITAAIERQASGFIFSDHFNIAYKKKINTWQLGVTAGIRHISNAGLEEPNLGIENIGLGFSLGKTL